MRIALISPRGPLYRHGSGIWKKSLRYMPLTLTTLAALVPPEFGTELELFDEGIREIDPANIRADIVGISAITGSAPRAYELADALRSRGITVVLGGPHPTLVPDEAAAHADAVVTGYAEATWPQLLRDFAAGEMRSRYDMGDIKDLANVPVARRDLLPKDRYATRNTIEATRGCLHDCEFCVVPAAWKGFFRRPVADVVDEIRGMKTRRVLFLDLNLIADLDYARELFTALIPLKIRWGGLTTTRVAWDEELLDLLRASGCAGLLLGLESLQAESLLETHKGFNMREDFGQVVHRLHERGIGVFGCFALGFDHDTSDVFDRTIEFVNDTAIDIPRFAILTPFPSTALYTRLKSEGRILTEDWSLYDAQHVVFQPALMTPDELQLGAERVWKAVYSYPSIARRLAAARNQLHIAIPANLAYRFYANNLHRYYTCGVSPV